MTDHLMLRRSAFGLLASGAVLLLAGATDLISSWSLVVGALLLVAASMSMAVALEAADLDHAG